MSPRTRKVVHAVAVASVGVLTDIGAQLAHGDAVNWSRAVVVGLVLGGLARLIGAALAASAEEPPK